MNIHVHLFPEVLIYYNRYYLSENYYTYMFRNFSFYIYACDKKFCLLFKNLNLVIIYIWYNYSCTAIALWSVKSLSTSENWLKLLDITRVFYPRLIFLALWFIYIEHSYYIFLIELYKPLYMNCILHLFKFIFNHLIICTIYLKFIKIITTHTLLY